MSDDVPRPDSRVHRILAPALVAIAGVLAYANSYSGVFMFDDLGGIVGSASIRHLHTAILNSTRPVVRVSFWLNYVCGGIKAADFHLVNVAIHITAGLVLYGIVRRTLRLLPSMSCVSENGVRWTSAVAAAIWVAHPLLTEGVTYISQRAESLMGLFYLLTIYCFVVGTRDGNGHRWYTAAAVSCALGMATKPVMVTAPLMVLFYDRFFLSKSFVEALRARWRVYVALGSTWIILAALLAVPHDSTTSAGFYEGASPWRYFLTEQGVILHYIRLAFWPDALCLDYAWAPVAGIRDTIVPGTVNMALLVVVILGSVSRNPLGFCGVWFFLTLAPSSSVIPIADHAAEHRMYLPLAGIVVGSVAGIYAFIQRYMVDVRYRKPVGVLAGACGVGIVLALGLLTFNRNVDYRSEEAMWRCIVDVRPSNLRARNDYAVALSEAGKIDEAMAQYEKTLSMIPDRERALLDAGKIVKTGVVMQESYEYNYFRAHANMGLLCYKMGDTRKSLSHYAAALRVVPYHENLRAKMKLILRDFGVRDEDAAAAMDAAIRTGKWDDGKGQ